LFYFCLYVTKILEQIAYNELIDEGKGILNELIKEANEKVWTYFRDLLGIKN
jgi:hypothetical protein